VGTKLVDKVLGFMGFEEEVPEGEAQLTQQQPEQRESLKPGKKGAVVSLHTQRQVKVVVVEPRSYDEVQEIVDHLKNRRPVIVNLEHAEADLARRVFDFVSGATYGLNGSLQKVSGTIVLFVPSNVDIDSPVKGAGEKGLFSWINRDRS